MISYPEVKITYSKGIYTFEGDDRRICKFFNDGKSEKISHINKRSF